MLQLTCTRDPVSLNTIGQVVLEYQAFEGLKSMKFTSQNNVTTMKHAIEYM